MILSSHEIVRRLEGPGATGCDDIPGADFGDRGRIVIRPYSRTCQQPASYDLRVADDITLPRWLCTLVPTLEWVELPVDLAATLRCRSSFGRRGIIITAGFVDPGFRGQLTLCLVNMGSEELVLLAKGTGLFK